MSAETSTPSSQPTCVHGFAFDRDVSPRWFEREVACPDCSEARRAIRVDIEAIEERLREHLPNDDPLHPDVYQGPFGNLWLDAALARVHFAELAVAKRQSESTTMEAAEPGDLGEEA